jgi:hypothetical protein
VRQADEAIRQAKGHIQEVEEREQKAKDGEQKAKQTLQRLKEQAQWATEQWLAQREQCAQKNARQKAMTALETEDRMRQMEQRALGAEINAEISAKVYEKATQAAEEAVRKAEERAKSFEIRAQEAEEKAVGMGLETSESILELESTVGILTGSIVSMHREIGELKAAASIRTHQMQTGSEALRLLHGRLEESQKAAKMSHELKEEKLKGLRMSVAKLRSAEMEHISCKSQLQQAQFKAKEKLKAHTKELDAVHKSSILKQKSPSETAAAKLRLVELDRDAIRSREGIASTLLQNAYESALEEKGKLELFAQELRSTATICDTYQCEMQRANVEGKETLKKHAKELDAMRLQRDHPLSTVECAVCIETKVDPTVLLPCCHSFCEVCVAKCLKCTDGSLKEGAECPICRAAITDAKRLF